MTFVVSDLHLNHDNIIEYCDRPFESVEEMNETLVANWNDCIGPEDEVLYLGDFVPFERSDGVVLDWLDRLNGEFVFIRGNHDKVVPITSHESLEYGAGGQRFLLTHYPEEIPDNWDGWALHGHHHNNFPDRFPFLEPDQRRVNVSIELLGYEPISMDELLRWITQGERLTIRPGVDRSTALQGEN